MSTGCSYAKAGEILVTGAMKDAATEMPALTFEDLGSAPSGAQSSFRAVH